MAHLLAFVSLKILRIRYRLILKNLDIVYGESKNLTEKKRIAYLSVYHFCLTIFEFFYFRKGDLAKDVDFIDSQHLQEVLNQGQGAYFLGIHMGNWEAMGSALTQNFTPIQGIVKKVGSKQVHRFVKTLRDRNGFYEIPRHKKGDVFKKIPQILKRGELVGFALDQSRPGCPKLPLFNKPAKTNTSFPAIWQKQPAPVVIAHMKRLTTGKHQLTFHKALQMKKTENPSQDIIDNAIYLNQVIEKIILSNPEQYFWMHNRWKI